MVGLKDRLSEGSPLGPLQVVELAGGQENDGAQLQQVTIRGLVHAQPPHIARGPISSPTAEQNRELFDRLELR